MAPPAVCEGGFSVPPAVAAVIGSRPISTLSAGRRGFTADPFGGIGP